MGVKSTPDPYTFEKYRDTPLISIAMLVPKYALLLAESSTYTTNLYILGSGVVGTPSNFDPEVVQS